ncbi:RNA polymerase I-specific transcription initiation factor RRN3 [Microthyrium microscopicum]|uniref:RNA polymerase I-specific transcription initiation factor RRN3 n=1 Tax=Microthyrium microscopicum TaxID=703497 RepID=A0A6A6UTE9_9PEZI|nr:RNA polymerase I-specific transcription initiation factor RRN3 [Microthyrium microscopicum]
MASAIIETVSEPAPARKLKRSLSEISPPTTPDAQQKRQKVSFSATAKTQDVKPAIAAIEKPEKPGSLVQEEVRLAIERHKRKDDGLYDRLKGVLAAAPDQDEALSYTALRRYLKAVTDQAYYMGKDCRGLLKACLACRWLEREEQIWVDFQRFLAAILSGHSTYLSAVMRFLVCQFFRTTDSTHFGTSAKDIIRRTFNSIKGLIRYLPAAESVLESTIRDVFPFHASETKGYVEFVKNILLLGEHMPKLQPEVLRLTMEKIIIIDAQLGAVLDALGDEYAELLSEQLKVDMARLLGDLPEIEEEVVDDDDNDDELVDDPEQKSKKALDAMKQSMLKVDAVLSLLFQHYEDVFNADGKNAATARIDTTELMVSTFATSYVKIKNSRHCQFLLFRFGQLNPDFYTAFTDALLKITFNSDEARITQSTAISYLASFAARGSKIDRDQVRSIFARLMHELDTIRKRHERTATGPDPDKYGLYYFLFQAVMYLFCFRWRDLLADDSDDDAADDEERHWLPGIKATFDVNINSAINPLKVCAPLIVDMFAQVTKALNFLYLYSKLETNKRVRLARVIQHGSVARQSALSMKSGGEAALKLDAHYAFEPYFLPTSKKWVDGLYTSFDLVAPPGMLDDESSDEE